MVLDLEYPGRSVGPYGTRLTPLKIAQVGRGTRWFLVCAWPIWLVKEPGALNNTAVYAWYGVDRPHLVIQIGIEDQFL